MRIIQYLSLESVQTMILCPCALLTTDSGNNFLARFAVSSLIQPLIPRIMALIVLLHRCKNIYIFQLLITGSYQFHNNIKHQRSIIIFLTWIAGSAREVERGRARGGEGQRLPGERKKCYYGCLALATRAALQSP